MPSPAIVARLAEQFDVQKPASNLPGTLDTPATPHRLVPALSDTGAQERLDELALEQKEGYEQWRHGHQVLPHGEGERSADRTVDR